MLCLQDPVYPVLVALRFVLVCALCTVWHGLLIFLLVTFVGNRSCDCGYSWTITKICLFKYIDNFTTKK